MKKHITATIVLAALSVAAPLSAQDTPPPEAAPQIQPPPPEAPAPRPMNMADLRHHVYVMEGALARAVDYGAKQLNREVTAAMPGVFMLEGDATARGMYLEGYGVFFDVRVPMMRQSMIWTYQMMIEQNDAANQATISELRKSMQGVTDANSRASLERAIRNLERQSVALTPRPQQAASDVVMPSSDALPVGAGVAAGVRPANTPPAESVWVKDPNRAYTEAVTRALVDAMIDFSTPMTIPAEQWLTVAARDDEGRDSLAPQDPLEEVVTMIYRIKGSDLQLYKAGKIDRDEVRKRVQLSQF
jgi:hypothetical protein